MFRFLFLLCAFMFSTAGFAAPHPTILVWGDSLSAGYGIDQASAWPTLLGQKLAREGYRYEVANASISGETTAGGRSRLAAALTQYRPAVVIIELGANDGLRGLSLKAMRDNLGAMISASQGAGAKVLLVGMRMPPNFGPAYTQKFQATFSDLSSEMKIGLVPFLMEGFAQRRELFQADSVHPIAEAQPLIVANIWPALKPLINK
jgi:acyl-CoA thioesterase I